MRQLRDSRPSVPSAHPYRFYGTFHETPRRGYHYALHLFVEGKGEMTVGPQRVTVEKDSLIFIPPGMPHSFINDDADPLLSYNVYFDLWEKRALEGKRFSYGQEPFEEECRTGIEPCPELEELDTHTKLKLYPRLSDDLIHIVRVNESLVAYRMEIVNALLYGWLLQWQQLTQSTYGESDYRIRRLVEQAAGSERIPEYDEWLAASGLKKSQFHAVFKQTTGLSPQQYIARLKMRKARTLLLESNKTITEVADELGFVSIHYFSRQFTLLFGVSPSAYRRNQRGKQ